MTDDLESLRLQLPDRYTVVKTLGQGGMGIVFKAHDNHLDKDTAVKMLTQTMSGNQVVRFHSEAKVLARLDHPNILTALDFQITENGTPFLVLDFIEGLDLETFIARHGPLSFAEAQPLFDRMLLALQYAHDHSVIHRDIKPSNVMLVKGDQSGLQPKLVDFGLSKLTEDDQRLTATGSVIGSPLYMSPEQARGKEAGVESDIYSLGCVFFYSLTGKPPIVGDNFVTTISEKMTRKAPKLSESLPDRDFPQELEALVEKMLAISVDGRYQSAREVSEALEELVADLTEREEFVAEPISDSVLLEKQTRRDKKFYLVFGLVTLLLTGLAITAVSAIFKKSAEEKKQIAKIDTLVDFSSRDAGKDLGHKELIHQQKALGRIRVVSVGDINDDDLQQLKGEQISFLCLKGSKVKGPGLAYVDGSRLLQLELNHSAITNDGLRHLVKFKELQVINLNHNDRLDETGLHNLGECKKLKTAKIQKVKLSRRVFEALADLKILSYLDIRYATVANADDLRLLSHCPNLWSIAIGGKTTTVDQLRSIASVKRVVSLRIDNIDASTLTEGLRAFVQPGRLQDLAFEHINDFPSGFADIVSQFRELRYLEFSQCRGVDKNLTSQLFKLAHLKDLSIIDQNLEERMDAVIELGKLRGLEKLTLDQSATPIAKILKKRLPGVKLIFK